MHQTLEIIASKVAIEFFDGRYNRNRGKISKLIAKDLGIGVGTVNGWIQYNKNILPLYHDRIESLYRSYVIGGK